MPDAALVIPEIVETELAPQPTHPDTVQAILAAFFAGKSPLTLKAYASDIQDYGRFLGVDTPEEVILDLLSHGRGHANSQALAYQEYLRTCGLQPGHPVATG